MHWQCNKQLTVLDLYIYILPTQRQKYVPSSLLCPFLLLRAQSSRALPTHIDQFPNSPLAEHFHRRCTALMHEMSETLYTQCYLHAGERWRVCHNTQVQTMHNPKLYAWSCMWSKHPPLPHHHNHYHTHTIFGLLYQFTLNVGIASKRAAGIRRSQVIKKTWTPSLITTHFTFYPNCYIHLPYLSP